MIHKKEKASRAYPEERLGSSTPNASSDYCRTKCTKFSSSSVAPLLNSKFSVRER